MSGRRYLYIVSSPHGGSTLLSLVLGKHPAAWNLGELSFIPKLLALRELCTCGAVLAECDSWATVFGRLAAETGVDLRTAPYGLYLGDALKGKDGSGLIDFAHQTRGRYLLGKLRGAFDTLSLLALPRSLGAGVTTLPSVRESARNTIAFYSAAAEALDKDLLIDASKLPRKAPHLYRAAPDRVRILHLVRDGRGVASSRKKYMGVARAAERWAHYHRLSRRILERWVPAEHRMHLRYEDFVREPEQHLRQLFDWLGMEWSDECLRFDGEFSEHSAGGNPARFELAGGIRPADERWRTNLSADELRLFDQLAGGLNREFGYE